MVGTACEGRRGTPMKIRAISLWEPWATAWAIGLKRGETRSWQPSDEAMGQPLAICSAKTERDPETGESLRDWFHCRLETCEASSRAFEAAGIHVWRDLPRGHVIAICNLHIVRSTTGADLTRGLEATWGNFSAGRYVWLPEKMTRLDTPIPVVGRQGLFWWDVPPALHEIPKLADIIGPF